MEGSMLATHPNETALLFMMLLSIWLYFYYRICFLEADINNLKIFGSFHAKHIHDLEQWQEHVHTGATKIREQMEREKFPQNHGCS